MADSHDDRTEDSEPKGATGGEGRTQTAENRSLRVYNISNVIFI